LVPARPGAGSQLQNPTGLAETHRWLELLKSSRIVAKEYLGVNECGCAVAGEVCECSLPLVAACVNVYVCVCVCVCVLLLLLLFCPHS
jgi:hypothetical protein